MPSDLHNKPGSGKRALLWHEIDNTLCKHAKCYGAWIASKQLLLWVTITQPVYSLATMQCKSTISHCRWLHSGTIKPQSCLVSCPVIHVPRWRTCGGLISISCHKWVSSKCGKNAIIRTVLYLLFSICLCSLTFKQSAMFPSPSKHQLLEKGATSFLISVVKLELKYM